MTFTKSVLILCFLAGFVSYAALDRLESVEVYRRSAKQNDCHCVPRSECDDANLRYSCGRGGKVCCSLERNKRFLYFPSTPPLFPSFKQHYQNPNAALIQPKSSFQDKMSQKYSIHDILGKGTPRPMESQRCGIGEMHVNQETTAQENEFPWTLGVYDTSMENAEIFTCGAALVSFNMAVTAAHSVERYKATPNLLTVKAGDWIIDEGGEKEKEKIPPSKSLVRKIIIHGNYIKQGAHNDIAVLILKTPFKESKSINTICIPTDDTAVVAHQCFVAGWGDSNSGVESIEGRKMKKVHVNLMSPDDCIDEIRSTDSGPEFELSETSLCGLEVNGLTGQNDGGAPLFCLASWDDKQFYLVGVTSWGKSEYEDKPTVFTSVSLFRYWINKASYGL